MARRVLNKHVSNASDIHYLNFEYLGEIVVCNEAGNEGIYVINTNHEPILIGSWSGDIDVDTDRIIQDLKSWVTANFASASDITNLQEQIDNISIDIDEEAVRAIVNGEIDKLIDSASTYNTFGKIERWINDHPSDVDPQLVNDVENLKAISADTRLDALESNSNLINERINELEAISANTRLDNLESMDVEGRIADLEAVSADTRIGELESISAATRLDTIEDKIDGVVKSTDHFVMTYQEYQVLLASGSVVVNGEYISYSDDYFYCIYEGDGPQPTPEPESGGGATMSGETITFNENYPYDDSGEVPSLYIGEIEDEGDGVIVVDWFNGEGGGSGDDTPSGEIEGEVVNIDSEYDDGSQSGEEPSINIGEIDLNATNPEIIEVPWEIDIEDGDDTPSTDESNIDDIINGSTTTFEPEGAEIETDSVNTLTLPDNFTVSDGDENGIITIE